MKNVLLLLLFISVFTGMQAQSILYDYGQQSHIRLELDKPIFSNGGLDFLNFGSFLNGHFRVGSKNTLAVELPFARFAEDAFGVSEPDFGIGGLSVAFQLRNNSNPNYFEFATRLPTGEGDNSFANLIGILVDYSERFSAFAPDLFAFRTSYVYQSNAGLGGYFRAKPGLEFWVFTEDDGPDSELLFDANIVGGYRTAHFDVNGGFTSVLFLTEDIPDDEDFFAIAQGMFFTSFTYTAGNFQPGLLIRLPMDEFFSDFFDLTIGVSLNYTFGGKVVT